MPTRPSAVVFAYHNVGARCLLTLLDGGVHIPLVVTHEDDPRENIWFQRVADIAHERGIPTITPEDVNAPEVVARIAALEPDFFFSFYFRQMMKAPLLAIPPRGAFNMHGSLLPKYRGRVPVNWAVIHGETETGASLHEMVEKPDAGRLVDQQAVPILADDTAFEVFNKVTVAAEICLHRALPGLLAGTAALQSQDLARGSYFGGRKPEDGRIDWRNPARSVHNLVRAVAPPYPGAFSDTELGRLTVLRTLPVDGPAVAGEAEPALAVEGSLLTARCGDGRKLRLLAAQLDGSPLDAERFSALVSGKEHNSIRL